jgi:hypothetical protein
MFALLLINNDAWCFHGSFKNLSFGRTFASYELPTPFLQPFEWIYLLDTVIIINEK